MTTITLTPELETALDERTRRQGTTPELLALDGLRQLYVTPQPVENETGEDTGETLFDFLKGYVGVLSSSEYVEGGARLSEECGAKFAEEWSRNGRRAGCSAHRYRASCRSARPR